ncbi:hypothetical protein FA15DRAFT_212418 [Coprinopsis marcescibilis]|uniref:Uncharacterized protein n=1 Tax=Coprinopsis marcescibilis TaxID=230819 RepID=A0A5C3L5I9_COPMA|nr:hypothetical protein FA15DRAFT_212418 [Coprinopsis marcescibilis]
MLPRSLPPAKHRPSIIVIALSVSLSKKELREGGALLLVQSFCVRSRTTRHLLAPTKAFIYLSSDDVLWENQGRM